MVAGNKWGRTEQIDELLFVDLNHLNWNLEFRVSFSVSWCVMLLICNISYWAEKLLWNSWNDTWATLGAIHRESFPAAGLPIRHYRWVKPVQSILGYLFANELEHLILTLFRPKHLIKLKTMPHRPFIISTGFNTLVSLLILITKPINDFDHIFALKPHNILYRILRVIIIEAIFNLIIRSKPRHDSHSLLFNVIVVRFFRDINNHGWCCSIGSSFGHFWQCQVGATILSGPCEGERDDLMVVHGCERVCVPIVCETKRWNHVFRIWDDVYRFSLKV